MELGTFSLSLSVKDLETSHAFYEKLGFTVSGGAREQGYLVMKNGRCLIGLFQGMFEGNMLTFNPGWDTDKRVLEDFTDVRAIQQSLVNAGIRLDLETDPSGTGIGHLMLHDPDGNVILIDQHVPKP